MGRFEQFLGIKIFWAILAMGRFCIAHNCTVSLISSMHGVLLEQKCLESALEAVTAQISIAKIIAEQVPMSSAKPQ